MLWLEELQQYEPQSAFLIAFIEVWTKCSVIKPDMDILNRDQGDVLQN